jgi:hypothetical protein
MNPQAPDGAVLFRQDRRKLAGLALVGAAFVALGLSFIAHPDAWATARHPRGQVEATGWVAAPFSGLMLAAIAVALARPTTVRLGPEGVTIRTAWRTYSRPWDAVSDFKIWKYRRNRLVVFNDADPPNGRLAAINRRISGATSSLPAALNIDPEQLLTAVQSAKGRWTAGSLR